MRLEAAKKMVKAGGKISSANSNFLMSDFYDRISIRFFLGQHGNKETQDTLFGENVLDAKTILTDEIPSDAFWFAGPKKKTIFSAFADGIYLLMIFKIAKIISRKWGIYADFEICFVEFPL